MDLFFFWIMFGYLGLILVVVRKDNVGISFLVILVMW